MAGLTSLESRASGMVSHCYARGAGTALGHRQAQLDSRRPGTGHWLSSPFMLLARKAHRVNSVSVSHTCCPRLCPPPPRGQSLRPVTEPHESSGRRLSPSGGSSVPSLDCLHCVAQVSIPHWSCRSSSPALGHTADPGCQQWAVPALRKSTRPSPSRPLTTRRRRESRQRMKPA